MPSTSRSLAEELLDGLGVDEEWHGQLFVDLTSGKRVSGYTPTFVVVDGQSLFVALTDQNNVPFLIPWHAVAALSRG